MSSRGCTLSPLCTRSQFEIKLLLQTLLWIYLENRIHNIISMNPPNRINAMLEHTHLTQIHAIHIPRIILSHPLSRYAIKASQTSETMTSTNFAMWQGTHYKARKIEIKDERNVEENLSADKTPHIEKIANRDLVTLNMVTNGGCNRTVNQAHDRDRKILSLASLAT